MWPLYFAGKRAHLTDLMVIALICSEMKWTWDEYQEQPIDFLMTLTRCINYRKQSENKRSKMK